MAISYLSHAMVFLHKYSSRVTFMPLYFALLDSIPGEFSSHHGYSRFRHKLVYAGHNKQRHFTFQML